MMLSPDPFGAGIGRHCGGGQAPERARPVRGEK